MVEKRGKKKGREGARIWKDGLRRNLEIRI
jgi:hypothetical protein